MQTKFIRGYFKKEADGKLTIIASDETLDRHGEVLKLESWDLTEFNKAPRLLVDHNHEVSSIVGKAVNTQIDRSIGALTFEPLFHEITQLSREVKEMVEQGFLDTVSVGFIPHGPEKDGDSGRNELIEISFVTVGANPNARAKALGEAVSKATISDDEKEKIEKFTGVVKQPCEVCVASFAELATLKAENETLKTGLKTQTDEVIRLTDVCEKQKQALTLRKKSLGENASKAMLKEVARIVNHGLYKINRS